jgi:TPR repeat protein
MDIRTATPVHLETGLGVFMGVFVFLTAAALTGTPHPPPIMIPPTPFPHAFDADVRKSNELGCRDGEQSFCYSLAEMLRLGIGGPPDPRRAESLFETACRNGYGKACSEVKR